ncbi:MAG: hypothetical protein JNM56_04500 [Planctomycetia bacterium]|nr:hypothetical protein [Planctomycetia bacterium]
MGLLITPDGQVEGIYDERWPLDALGQTTIRRQSHVDWHDGAWWALVLYPDSHRYERLGPFARRSEALAAEIHWIECRLEERHQCTPPSAARESTSAVSPP